MTARPTPIDDDGPATATLEQSQTQPPRLDRMPLWRVLLHNDDRNELGYVVETIHALTRLNKMEAVHRMFEAHHRGLSLLLTTHREHAELLEEQFRSKTLTVTIEPE